MNIHVLEAEPIEVIRIVAEGGVAGAGEAMHQLEERMGRNLKGRRMYGVYNAEEDEYSACLKIDDEHPNDFGLEHWAIPGGRYARSKVQDWQEKIPEFGNLFRELGDLAIAQGLSVDPSRPTIEFYRSLKEVHLLVAVE